jgi:hypothetical protein
MRDTPYGYKEPASVLFWGSQISSVPVESVDRSLGGSDRIGKTESIQPQICNCSFKPVANSWEAAAAILIGECHTKDQGKFCMARRPSRLTTRVKAEDMPMSRRLFPHI